MGDFKRVQTGQKLRIAARTWNSVLDATEAYIRRKGDIGAGGGFGQAVSRTVVLIQNSSGADVDRMNVLGISGPIFTPVDNADLFAHETLLTGVTPAKATHKGRFAVTIEPIKNGQCGLACVSGVCPVNLTLTSAGDKFADVYDGQAGSLLGGSNGSASILWASATSGTVQAIVHLGVSGSGLLWGKTTTAILATDVGNMVEINPCDEDGSNVDTHTTLEIYLSSPLSGAPAGPAMAAGTVLPYIPFYDKILSQDSGIVVALFWPSAANPPDGTGPAVWSVNAKGAPFWLKLAYKWQAPMADATCANVVSSYTHLEGDLP